MLTAILLVGGKATRLRSITHDTIAKCMVDINGVPFLKYQLDYLSQWFVNKTDRVILATGFNGKSIIDWVLSSECDYPFEILFSEESRPLGTGGAIKLAMNYVPEYSPAVVFNGDVWNSIDLWQFLKPSTSFKMALAKVDECKGLGVVTFDGSKMLSWNEKTHEGPGFINRGIYYIPAGFTGFDRYSSAFSFENDWMPNHYRDVIPDWRVGDFIDIGTPENYELFCSTH